MSYQVLARKWRPRNFKEMVGQEHVLQALINALDNDRLHHAYLFTGTRGVGKTTVARILAKCLNCEAGVSSQPCDECASCLEIAEGRSVDLIEVDAASRTKVEDTRELLENVQYAPSRCRYKVYLIDEVHMLSTHSFNALLKTLEEPPPHVKFLLATTDPQKLPMTVLSRCLQFNLKNMLPELIVAHLAWILEQESVPFEEPALWLLARSANGSMRDALSLTDQAIAYGSGQLQEAEVRAMLGTVDLSFVYRLLQAVAAQDAAAALQTVSELSEHAPDYAGTLQETTALLHRIAVAQAVPEAVDDSWGDAEKVMKLAAAMSAEDVQLYYQVALTGRRDIALAADLRSGLEMTLLRMIAFRPAALNDESLVVADLEDGAAEAAVPVKKPEPEATAVRPAAELSPQAAVPPEPVPAATPAPETLFEPGRWPELLEQLQLGGIVYNVASHMELRQVDGDKAYLVLDEANASLYNENHAQQLGQSLSTYLQHSVQVHVEIGVPRYETPAARAQRLLDERLDQAVAAIEQDPKVQLLIDHFEGTLDRESIAPIKH
ncbi:MAG: DNA polymerase III subunit gamma/tau [Gammaproteobacteria bacterium]|nr:DNA polymerase III subunit gamma/tau [Gammaproteobacteria bacterium]